MLSRLLAVLTGAWLLGCAPSGLVKPSAPDMTELVASYTAPDADFDPQSADALRPALLGFDELLARTDIAPRLFQALGQLAAQARDGDTADTAAEEALTLRADGYLVVTRICNGWQDPAVPDAANNGTLQLTATFNETGFDPVIWGSVQTCRYLVGESQLLLQQKPGSDVPLRVFANRSDGNFTGGDTALLFALQLAVTLDGEALDLAFDFRTTDGSAVEYRVPQGGGSFIASVGPDGALTVRANNGYFSCDPELRCAEMAAPAPGSDAR